MKKKYLENFYNNTLTYKQYEVFATALPITLLYKNMFNETEQFLKEKYDLLHSHIDVLATLYFNDNALSPTELYDATVFSSGGMTKVLKKLEEKKYISRTPSLEDKRSLLVCLTPLGSQLVEESLGQIAQHKEKIFNVLTPKEKENLKNILSKLTYSLY
ncbi:MAG: MarR family transcriptional regulator [Arcobacteraceae bacterium]